MVMNVWLTSLLPNVNQPFHPKIWLFWHLILKIHGQGHACGQSSRSHFWLSNKSIYFLLISHQSALPFLRYSYLEIINPWSRSWPRSKLMATFEAYTSAQSISSFFVSWQSNHFAFRCNNYLSSKLKVMAMAMVKPGHHTWSLGFSQNVSLSFCGNRTIFGWDIANSIFDWKFKVKVMNKIDQI